MAIVLSDVCNGFVEIVPEREDYDGDIEDYIANELGYDMDDLQWIAVDDMRVHMDWEARDVRISEVLNTLRLRDKLKEWKVELRNRLTEYQEAYIPWNTESLSILEYGENEFFWWKKEVYEDILEYMEKNGI